MRRPSRLVLSVLAAGAVAVAGSACGSSSSAPSSSSTAADTANDTATAASVPTAPATPLPTPSVVAADAVPAVTGAQGAKPTVAKPTGTPPTSLLAHDVIAGSGAAATAGAKVTVNYSLYLFSTGALVQSSYDTGQPFTFTLGANPEQVIPGFDGGVVGMQTGGRRELVIPPALGYGSLDQNGIPAGSTLIFVIDLVSVG